MRRLVLLTLSCNVLASDLCLMLSPVEESALLRAQEKAQNIGLTHPKKEDSLRLDGIIYTHEGSWTLWINGRSIKSGQKVEGLRILKVTPNSVMAVWSPSPAEHYEVSLKLNEVFTKGNTFETTQK